MAIEKMNKNNQRAYGIPLNATIDGKTLDELGITVPNAELDKPQPGIDKAMAQKIILPMPRGDLVLKQPDGRVMRRQMGASEDNFRKLFVKNKWGRVREVRHWVHAPTGFVVMATIDNALEHGELLHVSMSYTDHDPTWEEIKAVRATLFPPFVDVMMMLPDEAYYVNIQTHTFHIVQTPSPWAIG